MDNADDQLHVDWKRWLQTIANLVAQPLTPGMIPDIPFTKIAMTLSPRLLGRTTAGAGAAEQITVTAPLTLAAGALGLSTPLLAIYGGTGFASYAVGDVLYADTTTTLAKLADVSAGSYLRSGGVTTAPLWSTVKIPNTAVTGDLWYASAANTVIARGIGSASDVLTVSGGLPVWAAAAPVATTVTITNDVTTNATMFPTWVTANTGNLPIKVSSTLITWNPSTALFNVIGTIQADTLVQVGTGAGSSGGNTNLIRPTAASAFLNIKGGSGKAKMVIANELLTFISGNSSGAVEFNFGATASTNVGTRGMRFSTLGGFGLGNTFSGNEPGNGNMQVEGTIGAGVSTVTAVLHLKAGTIAASTAPLKFNSGSLLTTAEAGAVEFLTDDFYATITTGAARKGIVLNDGTTLTATRVPFATTNGRLTDSANMTFASSTSLLTITGKEDIVSAAADFGLQATNTFTVPNSTAVVSSSGTVVNDVTQNAAVAPGANNEVTGLTVVARLRGDSSLGSANQRDFQGIANSVFNFNTGTTGWMSGFRTDMRNFGTGGVFGNITNLAIYRAIKPTVSGGTVTNVFGLHLPTLGGAGVTNAYGVYQIGTDANLFTGITTFTAQPVMSSLTASQAVFTDGSKGLVSNAVTGTVNVVMSASPTLTGTVGLPIVTMTGKLTNYNSVATAGWGVPAIYGSGRSTAQTAAVASVAAYTVPATDGSFEVSANVLVTTATTHNFTVAVDYTDEGNTARTLTLNFSQVAGTLATAITNVTGAGPYEGVPLHIRCKASTAITVKTVGTFTTVTYNVEGSIRQIA